MKNSINISISSSIPNFGKTSNFGTTRTAFITGQTCSVTHPTIFRFPIHVINIDDQPWFVDDEILIVLKLNRHSVLKNLSSGNVLGLSNRDKKMLDLDAFSEPVILINLDGVRELIDISEVNHKEAFWDWLVEVVLPNYGVDFDDAYDPDDADPDDADPDDADPDDADDAEPDDAEPDDAADLNPIICALLKLIDSVENLEGKAAGTDDELIRQDEKLDWLTEAYEALAQRVDKLSKQITDTLEMMGKVLEDASNNLDIMQTMAECLADVNARLKVVEKQHGAHTPPTADGRGHDRGSHNPRHKQGVPAKKAS